MKRAFILFLLALAAVVTGCKSTEPDNLSARPWNAPRGWEHGIPSAINQGR